MFRFFTPRRLAILALAALALSAALAGCGKKITSADAGYTQIEGTPSTDSRLIVWPSTPTFLAVFLDSGAVGPSDEDYIIDELSLFPIPEGELFTQILDGTAASGFQVFRQATNGGYEPVRDFVLQAQRKWLESHWEVYEIEDYAPSGHAPPTYIGRGLLAGASTARSPLTNVSTAPMIWEDTQIIDYLRSPLPSDSLFTMEWTPVASAAGYWVHVYQYKSDATFEEKVLNGSPRAVVGGHVRDYLLAYVPAPTTVYKFGSPGFLTLTQKAPLRGQEYMVRITAVDANGQLVGAPLGSVGIAQGDGIWFAYPEGAFKITPGGHAPAAMPSRLGRFSTRTPSIQALRTAGLDWRVGRGARMDRVTREEVEQLRTRR